MQLTCKWIFLFMINLFEKIIKNIYISLFIFIVNKVGFYALVSSHKHHHFSVSGFLLFQVHAINESNRFEAEIRNEQEEKKRQAEEKKQRQAAFKNLQSAFK